MYHTLTARLRRFLCVYLISNMVSSSCKDRRPLTSCLRVIAVKRTPGYVLIHVGLQHRLAMVGKLSANVPILAATVLAEAPLRRLGKVGATEMLQEVSDESESVSLPLVDVLVRVEVPSALEFSVDSGASRLS